MTRWLSCSLRCRLWTWTWKILNTIIRRGKKSSNYPGSFTHNVATVKDKKDIAQGFNDFFVKVGQNLAKCIKKT